jgi:hypothetical protein
MRDDDQHAQHQPKSPGGQKSPAGAHKAHYGRLLAMAALSFAAMYVLMYAMVDSGENVFMNLNQAYMAGLMTAPMVIFELLLMGAMYANKRLNMAIIGGSLVMLSVCWTLIRQQTAIEDGQFLRSMIPHHAGALLMCEEAPIEHERIRALCEDIRRSQQSEIEQMKTILAELR